MQSWGTRSHFETRHTDLYPSKSAIIGLLAACLGYRRAESEQIKKLNELSFAIRVDQPGQLMKDYHTAKKYKKNGDFERTYVTERYYLEDAVFLSAISHHDDRLMDEIYEALNKPYFQPYMGRRSLPIPLDFILEFTDEDPVSSLENIPWQAATWYKKYHQGQLDAYADRDLIEGRRISLRKDYVQSFDQKNRQFSYREECHFKMTMPSELTKTSHDAMSALN